jgi:hypothetical protein
MGRDRVVRVPATEALPESNSKGLPNRCAQSATS